MEILVYLLRCSKKKNFISLECGTKKLNLEVLITKNM